MEVDTEAKHLPCSMIRSSFGFGIVLSALLPRKTVILDFVTRTERGSQKSLCFRVERRELSRRHTANSLFKYISISGGVVELGVGTNCSMGESIGSGL